MLVSKLQQFIRLLVPPLTVAGINQSAEKSVSGALEALATALEPFQDLTAEQLADLLRLAREYKDTGQIPEWAIGKKRSTPSQPKTPKAPKAPKPTPSEAVARLKELREQAMSLEPAQIAREVQALACLTGPELKAVQKEFLGGVVGKKKGELLAALQKRIDDSRESRERVEGILAH
jgi:hypothetical protein